MKAEVTMGSGMGVVSADNKGYTYAFGVTRGIRLLTEGCGVRMGAEGFPCIVKFRESKGSITEILSAKRPRFEGRIVGLAGSIFDTSLCPSQAALDADSPSCQYKSSLEVYVEKANAGEAQLRVNGEILYAVTQRVVLNCKGTRLSLRSFLTGLTR